MWFGDYVTMAWWNDLWLNESFASWLAQRDHRGAASRLAARRLALAPAQQGDGIRPPAERARASASPSPNTAKCARRSTASPTRKARRSSRCSSNGWGRRSFAKACAATWRSSRGATRPPRISSRRSPRPTMRWCRRFAALSNAPACRCSTSRSTAAAAPALDAGAAALRAGRRCGRRRASAGCFPPASSSATRRRGQQVCTLVRDATQKVPLPTAACPQWVVANRTGLGYYLPRLTPALYASLPKAERVLAGADYAVAARRHRDAGAQRRGRLPGRAAARRAAGEQSRPARGAPRVRSRRRRAAGAGRRRPTTRSSPRGSAATSAPARGALGWLSRKGDVARRAAPARNGAAAGRRARPRRRARAGGAAARAALAHRTARRVPPEPAASCCVTAARTAGKDAPRCSTRCWRSPGAARTRTSARTCSLRSARSATLRCSRAALALAPRSAKSPRATRRRSWRRRCRDPATRPAALAWLAAHADALDPRCRASSRVTVRSGPMARARPRERAQFVALFESRAAELRRGRRAAIARRWRKSTRASRCGAAQQAPLNAFLATAK